MAMIHEKMIELMGAATHLGKDRQNQQQHYAFRGIDDVYNALHEHMAHIGVFTTSEILGETHEERKSAKGSALIYRILRIRYHFHAADGSSVFSDIEGEGMDSGDKASNKAMAVAHKYALLQALAVPTAEPKDPEHDSPEPAPRQRRAAPAQPGPAAPAAAKRTARPATITAEEGASIEQSASEQGLSAADIKTAIGAVVPGASAWTQCPAAAHDVIVAELLAMAEIKRAEMNMEPEEQEEVQL